MITKIVVGGIAARTTSITNTGSNNTVYAPETGVRPPESAKSKGGRLKISRCNQINGRYHGSSSSHVVSSSIYNIICITARINSSQS